jgi:hypothetical protein
LEKDIKKEDDQIKDTKKKDSQSSFSSKCNYAYFLFLIIFSLITLFLVILFILKPKYDSEIEILKENIKILKDEISQETNKLNNLFSKGMIIAWYGEIDKIPENWTICDGTNGTPDLRNRFIIGSSEKINFGTNGGKSSIKLKKSNLPPIGQSSFSCDSHGGAFHHKSNDFIKYLSYYSVSVRKSGYDNWGSNLMIDLKTGMESDPIDIMNPYFALYFIMKM